MIGMHFFNPADRMKLVEVIAGVNNTLVRLKISTMDDFSYEIWRSYEDNNRFRSMFMSSSVRDVATNIQGGRGYWCGFNSFRLDFQAVPGTYPGNDL